MNRNAFGAVFLLLLISVLGAFAAETDPPYKFKSIYSYGDLIFVNPQQSTGIFLCVIVFSTLLEYLVEVLRRADNKYIRAVVIASQSELLTIGFAEMLLLFVVFTFSLTATWRRVLESIVMCLVYMAFAYIALITFTLLQLRVKGMRWRVFEWARIHADAHHTSAESLFKLSRVRFLEMVVSHIPEAQNCPSNIVIFALFMCRVERKHLEVIASFSVRTWVGLAGLIIVNGSRAVTADNFSPTSLEDSKEIHIFSFIIVMGYGTLLLYYILQSIFQHRFNRFLLDTSLSKKQTDAGTSVDAELQQCFFVSSFPGTLDVFKSLGLGMMWYTAVFIMVYMTIIWRTFDWWAALLIDIFAFLPVVLFVMALPWTINVAIMIESLGKSFDANIIRSILAGTLKADDSSESEGEGDNAHEEDVTGAGGSTREKEEEMARDGEWEGRPCTFSDVATKGVGTIGEPSKIIGVAPQIARPSPANKQNKFAVTKAKLLL